MLDNDKHIFHLKADVSLLKDFGNFGKAAYINAIIGLFENPSGVNDSSAIHWKLTPHNNCYG